MRQNVCLNNTKYLRISSHVPRWTHQYYRKDTTNKRNTESGIGCSLVLIFSRIQHVCCKLVRKFRNLYKYICVFLGIVIQRKKNNMHNEVVCVPSYMSIFPHSIVNQCKINYNYDLFSEWKCSMEIMNSMDSRSITSQPIQCTAWAPYKIDNYNPSSLGDVMVWIELKTCTCLIYLNAIVLRSSENFKTVYNTVCIFWFIQ